MSRAIDKLKTLMNTPSAVEDSSSNGDFPQVVKRIDMQEVMKDKSIPTVPALFAYLFDLDVAVTGMVLKDIVSSASGTRDTWSTFGHISGDLFVKCVDKLLDECLINAGTRLPKVEFIQRYSNMPDSEVVTLEFIVGNKLSQLSCDQVYYNGCRSIIGSDWDPCRVGYSPAICMIHNGNLTLDCNKAVHYGQFKDMCLSNISWENNITLKDGETLTIEGEVIVKTCCPISADGVITIKGSKGSKLLLKNTSYRQPCIGGETADNLSYGRWSRSRLRCKEIIVDNVDIVCESSNPNFMLGEYGTDDVPKVTLLNGGTLTAAETSGTRVMVREYTKPQASTKIEDDTVYEIKPLTEIKSSNKSLEVSLGINFKGNRVDSVIAQIKASNQSMSSSK